MGSHDAAQTTPEVVPRDGPRRAVRLAECPACHRTFDIDAPHVVALPVDLRQCPTCTTSVTSNVATAHRV